jgi:hypothetical protein
MPLKFDGEWRFEPPSDTDQLRHGLPEKAIVEFIEMVNKLSQQSDRWGTLEVFKQHFSRASGATHWRSSNESFAEGDLVRDAHVAAKNAPLFIEAFFDACRKFKEGDDERYAPDAARINAVLMKHNIGYEIRGDALVLRGALPELVAVAIASPTLAEQSLALIRESLNRADDLVQQGKGREAVQESLWLLETVSTAFRGVETEKGTIAGRYFNKIVKELRGTQKSGTLDRVLEWVTTLHGYLSSPTGGGVRHGLDLSEGVAITDNAARLFCNLIRSYIAFLLVEREQLPKRV